MSSHASDAVFEALAGQILRGGLAVGARLEPERVLAERFGVSRITVRQAVHRLAETGLLAVRQGGSTVVLDPARATDLRVLELDWRLGPGSLADVFDFTEKQIMQGHALLHVAQRRATRADLTAIGELVDEYVAAGSPPDEMPAFEERFWKAVAAAGGNRLYRFECNWWFHLLSVQPRARHPVVASHETRMLALAEIVRRLAAGEDAAAYYLQITTSVLDRVAAAVRSRREKRSLACASSGGSRSSSPSAARRARPKARRG